MPEVRLRFLIMLAQHTARGRNDMETYEVPYWMTVPMSARGVCESDPYLYGAGRALGFMKSSAV